MRGLRPWAAIGVLALALTALFYGGASRTGAQVSPTTTIAAVSVHTFTPIASADMSARAHAWQRTASTVNTAGHATVSAFLDRECAGGGTRRGPSVRGVLHGAAGVGPSAGWQRLWLVAVDAAGRPTCAGGDAFEVTVESADTRAVVDVVADLGRGLYELQVLLRRPGQFTLCSDLTRRYPDPSEPRAGPRFMDPASTADVGGAGMPSCPNATWAGDADSAATRACTDFAARIAPESAAALDAAIAAQRREDPNCTSALAYRAGEWRRIGRCTGVECVGDVSSLGSDGWAWLSDTCVVRFFSTAEAWDAVSGRIIVGWGDSTLKQPLANLVEYVLRVPLLNGVFMEAAPKRKQRKAGFFDYRQYDVTLPPPGGVAGRPVRVISVWGGCRAVLAGAGCGKQRGMGYRDFVNGVAMASRQGRFGGRGTDPHPAVLILNHWVWRWPLDNETEFVADVRDTVRFVHDSFVKQRRAGAPAPLLIWLTGTPLAHSAYHARLTCTPRDMRFFERHAQWRVEHLLATEFPYTHAAAVEGSRPAVRVISRYDVTLPFHHGDGFVHTGVHYGSTKGMCGTGYNHKEHYALHRCLRKTWPDSALHHMLLQAVHTHTRAH